MMISEIQEPSGYPAYIPQFQMEAPPVEMGGGMEMVSPAMDAPEAYSSDWAMNPVDSVELSSESSMGVFESSPDPSQMEMGDPGGMSNPFPFDFQDRWDGAPFGDGGGAPDYAAEAPMMSEMP